MNKKLKQKGLEMNELKNINLKALVKEHLLANGAQVMQCEQWLDLACDYSGNTYNENAPVIIQTKIINATDSEKTIAFLTFHNGGDPRGNYENDTYIIQGESLYDTLVNVYNGELGAIWYDWNTGNTEYHSNDEREVWTICASDCTIEHTNGDKPAPIATLKAIVENLYDADFCDFTLE